MPAHPDRTATVAAIAALTLSASAPAALVFDDVDVELWVGEGDRAALMVVDWLDDRALAFGYRWTALEMPTDFDMLEAVNGATDRFVRTWVAGMEEEAIFGLGWDADDDGFDMGDPDDWYEEGWFTDGFWSQWASIEGETWAFGSGLGAEMLDDGDWIGWSWAPDFIAAPPQVPLVPAPGAAALLVLAAVSPRRARGRRCRPHHPDTRSRRRS